MKKIALLTAIIICLGVITPLASAASRPEPVLICLIDRMNLSDIDPKNTPQLWTLMQQGAIGLLNSPSAGERNTENTYCTISAGSRVLSSGAAAQNFQADEIINQEKAGDVFFRNTGIRPGKNGLVVSSIATIKKNNIKRNLALPGLLGDQLRAYGDSVRVIGNSDLPGYYSRAGVLLAMDSQGLVEYGKIDSEMVTPSSQLGFESNYKEIAKQSRHSQERLLIIEFGDLTRLNAMNTLFSPPAMVNEKRRLLKRIDSCIGQVTREKRYQAIYIISASPDQAALEKEELLTPLIIVKPGFNGILSGISTRREGIVSSLVIKDSIISSLHPQSGESIMSAPQADCFANIQKINFEIISNYVNQKWFLRVIFPLVFFLLVLAALLTWWGKKRQWRNLAVLSVTAVPLNLLLISNITVTQPWHLLPLFLTGNLLITVLVILLARVLRCKTLALLALCTVICIALDLFFALGMLEKSMMSYRIMQGSRYYGLGNEYMGVLVGSAVLVASMLLQKTSTRLNRSLVIILFAGVVFLNAYPRFGINVGGAITAAIALGYTYLRYINQPLDLKKTAFILAGTFLLLFVMSIIDLQQPPATQSHLARNVNLLLHGEFVKFGNLILRKLQMQLNVMNFIAVNWVILAGILAACYGVFRPGLRISQLQHSFPMIHAGLKGLMVAAVAAIVFNDSGITAAASMFIYALLMTAGYWQEQPLARSG